MDSLQQTLDFLETEKRLKRLERKIDLIIKALALGPRAIAAADKELLPQDIVCQDLDNTTCSD